MTIPANRASPAVSVIVGTYNCARFLPGLWACLDAQTFRDFEVVVVDDASDDRETLAALAARGDAIRLIRRTTNSGTCELPRYQGVAQARASLCAFLDADDRWDPAFLQRCMDYLDAHRDAALVHTAVRLIDGDDRVYGIRHDGQIPTGSELAPALLRHCWITISAVVARRDRWLAALPEEKIRDFGMDQDFFVNIASHYPIGYIPEVLASYRRSPASVSVKKWRRAPRNVNTLERIHREGYWRGLATHRDMRAILVEAYAENAEHWRHQGYPGRALWFVGHGLRHGMSAATLWKSGAKAALSWVRGRTHRKG